MISVGDDAFLRYSKISCCFTMSNVDIRELNCTIYGETDASIAVTATFFWPFKHSGGEYETRLAIHEYEMEPMFHFDFSALQAEQFASVLDSNPTRQLDLQAGQWNAEQSWILATRPYPLNLRLSQPCIGLDSFDFEDNGTAFVKALETRESSFGSFAMEFDDAVPLSPVNLKRLLKLEIFDTIALLLLEEECVLLPLSTKLNALDYMLYANHLRPGDFDALDVAAKDLSLRIYVDDSEDWDGLVISFLERVADLGHFERIRLSLDVSDNDRREFDWDALAPVAKALICAIHSNPKLSCLDLSDTHHVFDWSLHFKEIFEAMEEHDSMRTFLVRDFKPEDVSDEVGLELIAPDYSWLEKLLSRNRNIAVLDSEGDTITNGSSIDGLYAFNRFYNGLAELVKESTAARPLLMATALVARALGKWQRAALLLANHTDVLCELVLEVDLEESVVSQPVQDVAILLGPSSLELNQSETSKRERRIQPPSASIAPESKQSESLKQKLMSNQPPDASPVAKKQLWTKPE